MNKEHLIIYADDDVDDLNMFNDFFEKKNNIKILPASDGLDALELIYKFKSENIKPSLIILDINMPLLGGKETLIKIKTDTDLQHIPIVLFSTSINPADKEFAREYGVEFLNKPLSYRDIELIAQKLFSHFNLDSIH